MTPVGVNAPRGTTAGVLAEIAAERDRQDAKWGGSTHDAIHSLGDWHRYLREHESRAESAAAGEPVRPDDTWRQQMVRVAALSVAAIEAYDERTGRGKF